MEPKREVAAAWTSDKRGVELVANQRRQPVAVIDASVYDALFNAHERGHGRSWAWLERRLAAGKPIVAQVILPAEATVR